MPPLSQPSEEANFEPVRGDQVRTGGVIHIPMFGRLLLSEFVVVDMTLANPNVFYGMGNRHTAKPFTTVPIFATIHNIPFDVALVRSIPYTLDKGCLTDDSAEALKNSISARLKDAIRTAPQDSPLFQHEGRVRRAPEKPAITFNRRRAVTRHRRINSNDALRA